MKTVLAILPLSEALDSAMHCPGTKPPLGQCLPGLAINIHFLQINAVEPASPKTLKVFFPISVRDALSADTKVKQILGDLTAPFLESSVFIQLCLAFGWDRVTFIHSNWYTAVFWS